MLKKIQWKRKLLWEGEKIGKERGKTWRRGRGKLQRKWKGKRWWTKIKLNGLEDGSVEKKKKGKGRDRKEG